MMSFLLHHKRLRLLLLSVIFLFSGLPNPANSAPLALGESLGGVKSPYTERLLTLLQSATFPASVLSAKSSDEKSPLQLSCWDTPGNDLYIGVTQVMKIQAPFQNVEKVLDDIDHYAEIFPGYDEIKVTKREENRLETFWEQHVPLFFVANVKYEMIYLLDSSRPDRKIYRYQLKKPDTLKMSDGFVFIQKISPTETQYIEIDFFDAEWGAAKVLGKKKIWSDAVEGIFLSDVGIKLKSENPSWDGEKVQDESQKLLEKFPIAACLENRKPFPN